MIYAQPDLPVGSIYITRSAWMGKTTDQYLESGELVFVMDVKVDQFCVTITWLTSHGIFEDPWPHRSEEDWAEWKQMKLERQT